MATPLLLSPPNTMTSISSIPTVDAFLNGFLHPMLLPIKGRTYKSLSTNMNLLKVNAVSIHTMQGSGNHGYLGLILSAPVYNIITQGTPFVIPNNPGFHPPKNGGTAATIAQTLCDHNKNLCQWKEYTNMHNALIKQLINAIEPIYLHAHHDCHVGFANLHVCELL